MITRITLIIVVVVLSAVPTSAQSSSKSQQYLAHLREMTSKLIIFDGPDSEGEFEQMFVNCAFRGFDDRYILLDSLLRADFAVVVPLPADGDMHYEVRVSETLLIVDFVGKPGDPTYGRERQLLADRSGNVISSKWPKSSIAYACDGGRGPIFETRDEMANKR